MTHDQLLAASGNAGWMLMSASLVLLMTPGLALFYGGMSGRRSALNMMMMSFSAMAVVPVIYVLWGWSASYGGDDLGGIVGNPLQTFGLRGEIMDSNGDFIAGDSGYPRIVDIGFQVTFAIIAVAIISGALAGRVKFGAWLAFVAGWVTLAYFPIAHMVWDGGLLSESENSIAAWLFGTTGEEASVAPVDFAGGTVVHISAGAAALVLALYVGARKGFPTKVDKPHNLPMVMLGAALLWFGWYGFNGGSAFAADGLAGLAWMNTTVATAAAMLGWMAVEAVRDKAATSLGAASGAVAGLVTITPAAGALTPVTSIPLGALGGVIACLAIGLKYRFGFDDSLDVVGVHLCAGLWGTVGLALVADGRGILNGHAGEGLKLLVVQVCIALVALLVSGLVTLLLAVLIGATIGWRVSEAEEHDGIDLAQHRESAYDISEAGGKTQPLMRPLPEAPLAAPGIQQSGPQQPGPAQPVSPQAQPQAAATKE